MFILTFSQEFWLKRELKNKLFYKLKVEKKGKFFIFAYSTFAKRDVKRKYNFTSEKPLPSRIDW